MVSHLPSLSRERQNELDFKLQTAVMTKELETVASLINSRANVNTRVGLGSITPLHLAVDQKWLSGCRLLMDHGADVGLIKDTQRLDFLAKAALIGADQMGESYVEWDMDKALSHGKLGLVCDMLQDGIKLTPEQTSQVLPLLEQAMDNKSVPPERIGVLINHLSSIGAISQSKNALFFAAIRSGREGILPHFTDLGPYTVDDGLQQAMLAEKPDMMQYFVKHGANLNLALDFAITLNHLDHIQFLINAGANRHRGLLQAISNNCSDAAKALINAGADLNRSLNFAVESSERDIVYKLLEMGAVPTTGTLNLAASVKKWNLFELFLDRKVMPNIKTVSIAAQAQNRPLVDFLINHGAIPKNEREDFVRCIDPFKHLPGNEYCYIVEIFEKIPANERQDFAQALQKWMQNNVVTRPGIGFGGISDLTGFSLDESIAFVKAAAEVLNMDPDFLKAIAEHQQNLRSESNPKEPTIDEILASEPDVTLPRHLNRLHPVHKKMLKKAMRIRNYYNKKKYICFLHGQEPSRYVLQLLMQAVAEIRSPEKHPRQPFVPFRPEKFYEQNQYSDKLIEVLKKHIQDDNFHRDYVMSVDAYFANLSAGESANYWCEQAGSVKTLAGSASGDLDPLLEGLPKATARAIKSQIQKLIKYFADKAPCGNLYVIAMPRDKAMKYSYPAMRLGRYCPCKTDRETFKQLTKANRGIEPKCTDGNTTQWRLAAAAMTPENGVRAFGLTRYDDVQAFIEDYIRPLAAHIVLLQNKAKLPTSRL